jgi:hypothetical protein
MTTAITKNVTRELLETAFYVVGAESEAAVKQSTPVESVQIADHPLVTEGAPQKQDHKFQTATFR